MANKSENVHSRKNLIRMFCAITAFCLWVNTAEILKTIYDDYKFSTSDQIDFDFQTEAPTAVHSNATSFRVTYPKDLWDPNDWIYLDGNMKICQKSRRNRIVVLIPSRVSNFHKRISVRTTWADLSMFKPKFNYTILFLVAKARNELQQKLLEAEQTLFADLIWVNLTDSYLNLTLKMLAGYSWVHKHCANSAFVYKIDDDTYVHLENMEKRMIYLLKKSYETLVYGGKCMTWSPVIRDSHSKFYLNEKEMPYQYYPPYCEGPFYFMSTQIAVNISKNCWKYPFHKFEDIFFASCIRSFSPGTKFMNVSRRLMPFTVNLKEKAKNAQNLNKNDVALHSMTTRELMIAHMQLRDVHTGISEKKQRELLNQLKTLAFGSQSEQFNNARKIKELAKKTLP